MSDTNQALTLIMSFDADQTSSLLVWDVQPNCSPTKGIYAGLLALPAQSPLAVVVSGNGVFDNPNGPRFSGFEVKDFSIVSRPKIMTCGPDDPVPAFAPPSMFEDCYVAVRQFDWQGDSNPQSVPPYVIIVDKLNHTLPLGAPGAWDVTIVLTVLVERIDGTSDLRVFYADIDVELYPAPTSSY